MPTLKLLAASQTREKDDVDTAAFRGLIDQLRERFDYVLIDCPAGIEMGFQNAIVGADEAIIVCTPEVSAVRDADRVVGLLGERVKITLIVNRLRPALVRKGKMLSVDDVNAILRLPLLGVIADEPGVIVATNKGEPMALDPALVDRRSVSQDRRPDRGNRHVDAGSPARSILHRKTVRGPPLDCSSFFKRISNPEPSSVTARERLRLVLLSDHLALAPDVVDSLKADLIAVISKYVDVDAAHCDVTFEQQESVVAMLANIPILGMKPAVRTPRPTPPEPPPMIDATPASAAVADPPPATGSRGAAGPLRRSRAGAVAGERM